MPLVWRSLQRCESPQPFHRDYRARERDVAMERIALVLLVFVLSTGTVFAGEFSECVSDDNCTRLELCYVTNDTIGFCGYKPLFGPFTWADGLCTGITVFAVLLSSGGGLGGGSMMLPFFMIIWNAPRDAVPMSKATIFGGAIGSFVVTARSRHPNANRPLIDYDVSLLLEPATLAGTIIGVFLNRVLPSIAILIMLILLVGFTVYRTALKGLSTWRQEAAELNAITLGPTARSSVVKSAAAALAGTELSEVSNADSVTGVAGQMHSTSEYTTLSPGPRAGRHDDDSGSDAEDIEDTREDVEDPRSQKQLQLQDILDKESRVSLWKLGALALLWLVGAAFSLIRGGGHGISLAGIECGSATFWTLSALMFPIFILFTVAAARLHWRKQNLKRDVGYSFLKSDVQWTLRRLLLFPLGSSLAGVAAALLGIGGGMVKGPLMLELGMAPHVATASASFMILFTSSFSTVQYLAMGALRYDYALWFAMFGFVGAVVGQLGVAWMLRKFGRPSMLVLFLAAIMALSGILMAVFGLRSIVVNGVDGFHSLC
eukprot:TRINITY_DN363_c0_g1_i1.p1 TRINITY_DN363_c0_g1~~TRINITY_DN363_c0_g1_i1.p1  ORF type:complete len:545 (+),score=92.68 TRINITY_DN363_c0_g1_i1:16-1650(+)